jgi:hypothetical protein
MKMVRIDNISRKKNFKNRTRFFAIAAILVMALTVALSACGAKNTPTEGSGSAGSNAAEAGSSATEASSPSGESGSSDAEASSSDGETGSSSEQTAAETPSAPASGEDLVIPVSDISETAKFYPVTVDGTELEVLAVTAPDGTIRTAFNTCQVCYDSGNGFYKQEGDVLVCQNCGNRFGMDQVEVSSGGCNPVPIFDENKTVDEENITIPFDFLNEAKVIFANWKA